MKYLYFALFFVFLTSCEKSDPNPHLSDEIYKDYQSEFDIAKKALETTEKEHDKLLVEKSKVVPQTGQIKFVQKKIYDNERQIESLKQQVRFFTIKLELRQAEDKQRYEESRHGGRPWPDSAELDSYKSTIKFQREKIAWDRNKGMKKIVPRGTPAAPASPEHGEEH